LPQQAAADEAAKQMIAAAQKQQDHFELLSQVAAAVAAVNQGQVRVRLVQILLLSKSQRSAVSAACSALVLPAAVTALGLMQGQA
jgi:hypothetical protein